jgi:hypothetical protein
MLAVVPAHNEMSHAHIQSLTDVWVPHPTVSTAGSEVANILAYPLHRSEQ